LLVKRAIGVLLLLLLIKLLWFVMEIAFFPAQGVNHAEEKRAKPLYYRIKLTPNEASAPRRVPTPKPVGSIREITLLGIYNAPDLTVVTVRYKGKSKVLGKGEDINGFVLERAGNTYAIFTKGGKEYKVTLHQSGSQNSAARPSMVRYSPKSGKGAAKPPAGEIVDAGDRRIIDRSLLEHYTTHMDDIYKNIGLKELKKGKKIEGFRVTFVKRGSPFSKLGLKRGDVIKAVNGEVLTSYKRAFDIYKHIGETESVTLVIKRGNKEMELEYEVN